MGEVGEAPTAKRCSKCGIEKPLSDFNRNHVRKDGVQVFCRSCENIYRKARYVPAPPRIRVPRTEKRCSHCGMVKPLSDFYRRRRNSENPGASSECKRCNYEIQHAIVLANQKRKRELILARREKKCCICKIVKPLDQFPVCRTRLDGKNSTCKSCLLSYQRQRRKTIRGKLMRKEIYLKRDHDITTAQYSDLLRKQNYVCAICGRNGHIKGKPSLAVDHDHRTGKIRGLLCFNCNTGLGKFDDDPKYLLRASQYLANSATPQRETVSDLKLLAQMGINFADEGKYEWGK